MKHSDKGYHQYTGWLGNELETHFKIPDKITYVQGILVGEKSGSNLIGFAAVKA